MSVVLNGKEPQFADAAGNVVPRPLVPPRVASPINLLNPDRYEFYTFNDNGDLVKRLMTMKEIQSIVANGDSETQASPKTPNGVSESEANIRGIVSNVQKVLHKEIADKANVSSNVMHNKLDTPDTSSSWSSILPAVFGNTGEPITNNKTTLGITSDSVLMPTTKKPTQFKTKQPATTGGITTINGIRQKPKPSRRTSTKSPTTQNVKHGSVNKVPVKIVNNIVLKDKTPPNKFQQAHGTTIGSKPTKGAKPATVSRVPLVTIASNVHKVAQGSNSAHRVSGNGTKTTPLVYNSITTNKPLHLVGTKTEAVVKRPVITILTNSPNGIKLTSTPSITTRPALHSTNSPSTTTKKVRVPDTQSPSTITTKKKPFTAVKVNKVSTKTSTRATTTPNTIIEIPRTTTTTTTTPQPFVTVKLISAEVDQVTKKAISNPTTTYYYTTDAYDVTTEMPDIFDSAISLNQIIETLKDTEGTTMRFDQPFMYDTTTSEGTSGVPPMVDNINTESVTVINNGADYTTRSYITNSPSEFKQSMGERVTYIPHTTVDQSNDWITESFNMLINQTTDEPPYSTMRNIATDMYMPIQHKENGLDSTTDKTGGQSNPMDNIMRESFDSVLLQIQNEITSTTDTNAFETTTLIPETTTDLFSEKKKVMVKPTPYIDMTDADHQEPMKYFENIIKEYEREKEAEESKATETTTEIERTTLEMRTDSTVGNDIADLSTLPALDQTTVDSTEMSSLETEKVQSSTENQSLHNTLTEDVFIKDESSTDSYELHTNEQSEQQSTGSSEAISTHVTEDISTLSMDDITTASDELLDSSEMLLSNDESVTMVPMNMDDEDAESSTKYQMVELIENSVKIEPTVTASSEESKLTSLYQSAQNSMERKEDSQEMENMDLEMKMSNAPTLSVKRDENAFVNLGEGTTMMPLSKESVEHEEVPLTFKSDLLKASPNRTPIKAAIIKLHDTLDQLKLPSPKLPPSLDHFKNKIASVIKPSNPNSIQLDPAPKQALGLEESTISAQEDILEFTRFCNQVAFNFWRLLNNEGVSSARSLVISPFALTSMLSMIFLGARGRTSSEINDVLHLDDIVTFNPHAIFYNITQSVENEKEAKILTSAFVRVILSDRSKGKILSFYKEKVQQFYSGYVEEVNFNTVNDIVRRRTNLLVKRHTSGKVIDYLKTNNIWVKTPLSGISANIFETDCTNASKGERDGEMFFQVLPAIRQRRLVPIPAAVWKSGFTAGYDPELDATAVAIGLSRNTISTIFVMPGQQGHSAPGDNLERLESVLMANAVTKNAWRRLLATLMERPGLEVQIPRFIHRSFINTTNTLQKLGLQSMFDPANADLRGITGSIARDMFVSDLVQINTFSTCGEDKLAEEHHVEMYPAPPNKYRTMNYAHENYVRKASTATATTDSSPNEDDSDSQRAFADELFDLKYLNMPLPLRPRQARIPDVPRLRFDKPFIYFVRHNPTGMVLYMGRFNPRLLP